MTESEYTYQIHMIRNRLITIARSYLGNSTTTADDVVQDVCIKIWNMHERIAVPVASLAIVMVKNLCIDQLRKEKREAEALTDIPPEPTSNIAMIDGIMDSINTLSPLLQNVFRLRHIEGKEIAEIAIITGSSQEAVRKALSRARISIRENFLKKRINNDRL
ncbi:MAG: RNA polymerase sigma factor [Muribaculum sp.]|nr:RNA polymerase sigma factor [Muribaculaceae bacterium]MCM1080600.1 RNA polymerase sigma factor [Muribaculum sp.]